MNDEIPVTQEIINQAEGKPTYIMVSRRLMITWITTSLVLFIGVISSFQYANYVDRKSSKLLCGIINLSATTARTNPTPPTLTEEQLRTRQRAIAEFGKIQKGYGCI